MIRIEMRDAMRRAFLIFMINCQLRFVRKIVAPIEKYCYNKTTNYYLEEKAMKLHFLEAGEIVSTHGVRGEMKVLPWSDGPEFLLDFCRVYIGSQEYKVEKCRVQKTCNLLKLQGIDSIEAAQLLRGKVVNVNRDDAPDGIIFAAELIGVRVFANDDEIGKVVDVLDYPGNKVYVVEGEHRYMIPAVKQFVLDIDIDNEIMLVALIEGMRTDED